MPGPPPTDPARRRRTNKVAGARTLAAVPGLRVPALPATRELKVDDEKITLAWRDETREWWWHVWTSPMAPEYDESDLDELLILAVLVDEFWRSPSKELAGEIRLQRQCFGLTPIDRRRLQWEILKTDEAEAEAQKRRAKPAPSTPRKDPRKLLA